MTSDAEGKQFLTVDKAALILGQNRLRVREAIARGQLQARRDNEGRMRVDLTDLSHVPKNGAEPALAPDAMLGLLFDEIEELGDAITPRATTIGSTGPRAAAVRILAVMAACRYSLAV